MSQFDTGKQSDPNPDVKAYLFLSVWRPLWEMHFVCLANILAAVWLAWIIEETQATRCLFVQKSK